ncbi:MAG: flippase-like domain-containing protein [Muribaculaceae bacterium]|nr:flippase-like domain-containing protein [Muribaculaceae bacterium]
MLKRVILPLLLGIGVTFFMFKKEFTDGTFLDFEWTPRMIVGLLIACVFMCGRDFGLAWRFHTIASPTLSWRRAIKVDLMCAFTSAVTPSAMGGSAFAIFYLNREGVKLGKATTMTLTTLFLDELFFVIFCPIIILFTPLQDLFDASNNFLIGVEVIFWLVYAGIVVWTAILFVGILVKPHIVAKFINRLFQLKWLRRWSKGAREMGNNMIEASQTVKNATLKWWLNVFGATVLSWFSRYLIVNALFWGFIPGTSAWLVFSRQFVVWVVLMISPTPGGSGISEWLFTEYYGDLIGAPTVALILALSWRLISYYVYLIIGSVLLPSYFGKRSVPST